MLKRIRNFLKAIGLIKPHYHYVFRDRSNPEFEVRRAFYWDGYDINRSELKKFLGHNPVKFYGGDGSATICGYNQITLAPGMFIWEDSDGFDVGNEYYVDRLFIKERV